MPVSLSRQPAGADCRLAAAATVVATHPDGSVDLQFSPPARCAGCSGHCLWQRLDTTKPGNLRLPSALPTGASVLVTIPPHRMLMASVLLYGLPLAALLGGAAAGFAFVGSDAGTLIGALAALVLAMSGFRFVRERVERATVAGLSVTERT